MGSTASETPIRQRPWKRAARLSLLFLVMAAAVIVPFVLFGEELERMTREAMAHPSSRSVAAWAGIALLLADIVLPVPSTLVITGLGAILGPLLGTLVAATGLTLGCLGGYGLGRILGQRFAERAIRQDDLDDLRDRLARHGALVLALCRPVPVLAEASVIVAGLSGMAAKKVLAVTGLANVGVAAVYATLGGWADSGLGFAIALTASFALPGAAILLSKAAQRRAAPSAPRPQAHSAPCDPERFPRR